MKKISSKNQAILDEGDTYGLDLNLLRNFHGLKFTLKLFKYLKKQKGVDLIDPLYPEKISRGDYINNLICSGFKIKECGQEFIDEETGEIIYIPNFNFETIYPKSSV